MGYTIQKKTNTVNTAERDFGILYSGEAGKSYCLVTLDVFRRFPYAKERSEQTALRKEHINNIFKSIKI